MERATKDPHGREAKARAVIRDITRAANPTAKARKAAVTKIPDSPVAQSLMKVLSGAISGLRT
jgi:hypothetical protein